jgi:hypothetical protein
MAVYNLPPPGDFMNDIPACFIVDDFPACPIYQTRAQGRALGFDVKESGYAAGWQEMDRVPLTPVSELRWFADFVDEFDIRGKFTCLPFPAGFGRLDQAVRGYAADDLRTILALVRERICPRFDITPETLSHTLACDPDTGAMFPHAETHWLSFLAREKRIEELAAYIRKGYRILANCGIEAHGVTMGGMPDLSGISNGQPLTAGFHREALAEALVLVENRSTFMYTGGEPRTEASRATRLPEVIYAAADGKRVHEIFSRVDPLWFLMHGRGDASAAVDRCITHDLERGVLVEDAEAGRAVVITVHSFTLSSNGTLVGQRVIREIIRRLRERYGKRLRWMRPSELCGVQA